MWGPAEGGNGFVVARKEVGDLPGVKVEDVDGEGGAVGEVVAGGCEDLFVPILDAGGDEFVLVHCFYCLGLAQILTPAKLIQDRSCTPPSRISRLIG